MEPAHARAPSKTKQRIGQSSAIGVDHLMWGSDYPHFDSTFPKSHEAIERNFEGVPEAERQRILSDNTIEVYQV